MAASMGLSACCRSGVFKSLIPLLGAGKPARRWCISRSIVTSNLLAGVQGTKILMPALSPTMEEGTILKWLVKEGDPIAAGDAICEIETDKATVTLDADDDGVLAKILIPEGTKGVKISNLIALVVPEGEDHTAVEIPADRADPMVVAAVEKTTEQAVIEDPSLSPAVRHLLDTHRLVADGIPATGPHGRLLKGDVLEFIKGGASTPGMPTGTESTKEPAVQPQAPPPQAMPTPPSRTAPPLVVDGHAQQSTYTDIELSNIRKVIAKRLTESKTTIPHSYASTECRMDAIMRIRGELKNDGIKISVNDFMIKAVAAALKELPDVNATWTGTGVQRLADIDISVAVATDKGLITPIVKNAVGKGLAEISADVKDLAARAKNGKLQLNEFQGGSFCVSNLGMYGVTSFSAVINPPQACILAVGSPRPTLDPSLNPQAMTTVTLSSDSRVVSDGLAARFLRSFKRNVENPIMLGL